MKLLRSDRRHQALLAGGHRFCGVAAAMVGSAVVGGAMSGRATKKAAQSATDAQGQALDAQERIADKQLAYAEKTDAATAIRLAKADALTEKVTNKQLESMDQSMALAKDYDEYNKGTYRPLEQSIVEDAKNYDTPLEQERAAGVASAAVKQNMAQATEANARTQARMGVNPNSGRAMATQSDTAISAALGEAGAENGARQNVKTLGAAKRMDAASLGRGLPSAQATSAQLGIAAGGAAISGTNSTNGTAFNGAQAVGGLYGGAAGTFGNVADTYGKVISSANAAGAASGAAWGSIAGMGMGLMNKPPVAGGTPMASNVTPG